MKNIALFFLSFILLTSCKKSTAVSNNVVLEAQTLTDVSYGNDAAQKMDVYLPAGRSTDSTKLLILVHGGAWVAGDKTDFTPYVSMLQQRLPGYAIANINYRLATTTANHFPTQENDMKAAVDFLLQKSGEYHIAKKLVLMGASSGGHLVTLQAYKYASPSIRAVVNFFGPVDMVDLYNSTTVPQNQLGFQILIGGTPVTNPSIYQQSSPINFVTAQAPPTIIFHGAMDALVPVSQATALKNKLQSFGVVNEIYIYPNEGHTIWPMAIMEDTFNKISLFLKTYVQ